MSNIEVYEIDDQFDPLEDFGIDEEEIDPDEEYQVPIPDAELSRVEPEVILPPKERIEKMLTGMPGQKQRILYAIELCTTPKTLDEIVEQLDEAFPAQVSVYDSAQIVKLLERAGALESNSTETIDQDENAELENLDANATTDEVDAVVASIENDGDDEVAEETYLTVTAPAARDYFATAEGLEIVELYSGEKPLVDMLLEEKIYLPLYQRILEMTSAEGGCPTKELDAAIDVDPLCAQPRRFCSYFMSRLEGVGAVQWNKNWIATPSGTQILESDLFTMTERS